MQARNKGHERGSPQRAVRMFHSLRRCLLPLSERGAHTSPAALAGVPQQNTGRPYLGCLSLAKIDYESAQRRDAVSEPLRNYVIELHLPYPPTLNTYYRHVVIGKSARVLLSKAGRLYRTDVKRQCVAHAYDRKERFPTQRIALHITLHAPDHRRRDLDNANKGLLDALAHAGVYTDDSQIDALHVVRGPNQQPPCVVVRIEALPEAQRSLALVEPLQAVPF